MSQTIKLWIYPGANPNSSPTSWGPYENDISAYVRRPGQDGGAPINYSWGKQDESLQTDAGQITLTLDNRDGRFSTDKIDGPWYGTLDINTPLRLGVVAGSDTFTRTVSGALGPAAGWGGAWGNTTLGVGTTTFSVDGSKGLINTSAANIFVLALLPGSNSRDVDITTTVVPVVTATGAAYGFGAAVRYTDSNNFVFSTVEFNTAGNATIKIRRRYLGTETELASSNPIPSSSYTAGQSWVLRTQMDGDTMRIKAWPSSSSEPSAWMLSADDGDNAGYGIGIYAIRFVGNTNGAVNFVGLDSISVTSLEATGYVVSWPLRWDITGNNSWAPITASGILRRLRQGTNPVQSPLRRQLGGTADVSGYWPLEEGANADYFLPVTAGVAPATFSGVTPGQDATLAGGGIAPVLNAASSTINAQTKIANAGNGMAAAVFVKLPSIPSTKTRIIRVRTSRGPAPIWDFSLDSTGIYIEALAADGTVLGSTINAYAVSWANQWIAWQLETDNSGGSTAYSCIHHAVGVSQPFYAQTGTISGGTNSVVSSIEVTGVSGMAVAHIWLGQNTFPFVDTTFANVSSGYDGERAARRFIRVCGEAGIPYSVAGANSLLDSTERMGPQKEGSTLAVLQACADADYGVITERGAGLELVPRASRWNLTQSMALSVAAGQVANVPLPTRDDQRLRNRWTISRSAGSSATAENSTSVARNGTWEDSATLNVFDDSVLANHAAWRVNVGTQVGLRWPSISINLARNPSLIPYWRGRFYGWRFGVTTGMSQVKGNEPDLIMEGFQASLTPENWTVEMNATDAGVWAAAVTDDTGIYGRADNEYCTTTALISATATSIPITTGSVSGVNMPKWDNTAALWSGGVDFNIGGERVTVTSITNGAGQAQTLVVSARGVNGYASTHASGTSVSLWFPPVVAL